MNRHAAPKVWQSQSPSLWTVGSEFSAPRFCEVWACNFDDEMGALLEVATRPGAVLGLDMEFPGFVRDESRFADTSAKYRALRESVDILVPMQVGIAVASLDGTLRGVWSFNMRFDPRTDYHTEASLLFLCRAGINLSRLAQDGIDVRRFGQRLAASPLFGCLKTAPLWVTFSGSYDLGYLYKLLTEQRLPAQQSSFDECLASLCPRRYELRDKLPFGSLESLVQEHGLHRCSAAHNAGSDALATLELFLTVVRPPGLVLCRSRSQSEDARDNHSMDQSRTHERHPWVDAARQCVCLPTEQDIMRTTPRDASQSRRDDPSGRCHRWVEAARQGAWSGRETSLSASVAAEKTCRCHAWVTAAKGQPSDDGLATVHSQVGASKSHPWLEAALRACH